MALHSVQHGKNLNALLRNDHEQKKPSTSSIIYRNLATKNKNGQSTTPTVYEDNQGRPMKASSSVRSFGSDFDKKQLSFYEMAGGDSSEFKETQIHR